MEAKAKKTLSIIGKVATIVLFVLALLMVAFAIFASVALKDGQGSIFGYRIYIVASDSMKGIFSAGDLIIVNSKTAGSTTLGPGDIITFVSGDPDSFGEIITHCIKEATIYQGNPAYLTYGYATGVVDEYPALASDVLGTYVGKVPYAGYFLSFIKSPVGYVCCILLPFLIIIAANSYQLISLIRGYRKEKGIDKASILKQKEEAEKENERLREQIRQLEEEKNKNSGEGDK